MKIYNDEGYADMNKIMSLPYPLIFVIGGRGTGKTYGAVEYLLDLPEDEKFFFLRRTVEESDTISYFDFSPFAPVINDNPEKYGLYTVESIPHVKSISGLWHGELTESGKIKPTGDALGYIGSMFSIHKIRGFNMQDVTIAVYDEFIPEKHARAIKGEGEAFLNAYETLNRNRELKGKNPMKMVCLSNANTIASPIFQSLGILDSVNKMILKGKQECLFPDRGVAVIIFRDSPISEKKRETALYRAAQDVDFKTMSLDNNFDSSTNLYIGVKPIDEYKIMLSLDNDVFVYRHKSRSNEFYVTRHKRGTPQRAYVEDEFNIKRFKRTEKDLLMSLLRGNVTFSDYYCKYMLTKYL